MGLRYTPDAPGSPAVLSPADVAASQATLSEATRQRLEFLYAKDYEPELDWRVLWRGWRQLGGS